MTTLNLPDGTMSYNTETIELLEVTYSTTCALQPAAERQREQAKRRESDLIIDMNSLMLM